MNQLEPEKIFTDSLNEPYLKNVKSTKPIKPHIRGES